MPEQTSSIDLENYQHAESVLFDYRIFPPSILRYHAQWEAEGRRMKEGDIVIQRAIIPPLGRGVCLEFAVRITSVRGGDQGSSFSYETLQGHPERGTAEFSVERSPRAKFTIHTHSQPGQWLSMLVAKPFTLPYQNWVTQKALRYFRQQSKQSPEKHPPQT